MGAAGDQCSQKFQWFYSSTFPFLFFRSFISSGNRSGLVGTGSRALMGWVGSQSLGIYVEESLGYCSSFESQIHEHVGVEGQNLGIFCCATSGITGAPRIQGREGCQQLNQDYNGLESNNNQKHWGPGVCFSTLFSILPWKCLLFNCVFLPNVLGILGIWSRGVYWDFSSRRRFFFQGASEFLFPCWAG